MRRRLKPLIENRLIFTGTLDCVGYKPGFKGRASTMTALIKNINTKKGKFVTKHAWLSYTKRLQELNLSKGDIIQFEARVKEYTKGLKGTIDYKLSHPTKVKKLSTTDSRPHFMLIKKRRYE